MKALDEKEKEAKALLDIMGFTQCSDDARKWEHKMSSIRYDFSKTGWDTFWVMNAIFKAHEKHGAHNKCAEIRDVLGIYS